MRTLLMLRGAPGCGKSTFVREHQLEPYTISSDTVRLLYRAPVLDLNGR
ncbi:MAG TPA: serine/threonine protein phosphatase, partial [Succinivibrionaceae bacterium]|nr:serine/threonine protein phosphatase [Succinivibrionaceae bacterium]